MTISRSKVDIWNRALSKIGETALIESEDDRKAAAHVCRLHFDDIYKDLLSQGYWPFARREVALTEVSSQSSTVAYASLPSPYDTVRVPFPMLKSSQLTVVHIDSGGTETTLTVGTDYEVTLADASVGQDTEITLTSALTSGESVRMTVTVSREGWDYVYNLPSDYVSPIGLIVDDVRYNWMPTGGQHPYAILPKDDGSGYLLFTDLDSTNLVAFDYQALVTNYGVVPRAFIEAVAWRLAEELALGVKKDPRLAEYCHGRFVNAKSDALAEAQNSGGTDFEPLYPTERARWGYGYGS